MVSSPDALCEIVEGKIGKGFEIEELKADSDDDNEYIVDNDSRTHDQDMSERHSARARMEQMNDMSYNKSASALPPVHKEGGHSSSSGPSSSDEEEDSNKK